MDSKSLSTLFSIFDGRKRAELSILHSNGVCALHTTPITRKAAPAVRFAHNAENKSVLLHKHYAHRVCSGKVVMSGSGARTISWTDSVSDSQAVPVVDRVHRLQGQLEAPGVALRP